MKTDRQTEALKAFISAVAEVCFDGNLAEFGRALGHQNGDSLRQMKSGKRPVTLKTLRQVWELSVVKARMRDGTLKASGFAIPVAHDLSYSTPTLDPIRVEWGELVRHEDLPEEFCLEVRDQSMSGLLSPGDSAFFSRSQAANVQPGDRILVVDPDGNGYIRIYRLRTPGHWWAVPLNEDYAPLDSVADGLRMIAAMTGLRWASKGA